MEAIRERTAAPAQARAGAGPGPRRPGWLLPLASAYLAFVVYGSLVPLAFRPIPWAEAVDRFRAMPFLQLGIGSRADWVANVLLFIPLAFLWAGVLWPRRRAAWRPPVALMLVAAAFGLAAAIEFSQIYFPPRTVSINDIGAETLGAMLGVAAWWAFGARVENWTQTFGGARGSTSMPGRLLTVYLLVMFAYNVLPLDLTISPVEVYHKWREGKVIVVPFTAPFASRAHQAYDLLSDIALWIPVALLWRLSRQSTALQAWTMAVTAAGVLEVLQLFVYSRVSDTTDLFTAAVGAAIGARLAAPWLPRAAGATAAAPRNPTSSARVLPWILAIVGWLGVVAVVFWYPFDFNFDRDFLRGRLQGLQRVPFEAYYYGTEFRAITEVLHKTLFMAPLGFLLVRAGHELVPRSPRWIVNALALLLLAFCAGAVELVQLALPQKNCDLTDAVLAWLGGASGVLLARWLSPPREPRPGGQVRSCGALNDVSHRQLRSSGQSSQHGRPENLRQR